MLSTELSRPPRSGTRAESRLGVLKDRLDKRAQERARLQVKATESSAGRADSEEQPTGLDLRDPITKSRFIKVATPAVAIALTLAFQIREAAGIDIPSASELGPTPRILPTPDDGEAGKFEATIEAINRESDVISESTPTGDSLKTINREVERPSSEFEISFNNFSEQETKWLEKTLPQIVQAYKNIFGEPFYQGNISVRRGDVLENCDMNLPACVFTDTGEIIWDEKVDLLAFANKKRTLGHELGHIFSGNLFWEKEMDKLFGIEHLSPNHSLFSHGVEVMIGARMGEPHNFNFVEGDIFYQAYKRDPRFFLKIRNLYEEEERPQNLSFEEWLVIADEVSPGFSKWLKEASEGPEYELPEIQGREFNWTTIPPLNPEGNPRELIWISPEPIRWFMPPFGNWRAAYLRRGVNDYLVWPIVAEKRYPEVGPEGTLPVYNPGRAERDPTRDALGEWR